MSNVLAERERVPLTITNKNSYPLDAYLDREFLESFAGELANIGPAPTHARLREILSHDKSPWSDPVIAERQEQ